MNSQTFSSKEISSPKKDLPVVAKTLFTHLSNLHGLLINWLQAVEKGTKICKSASALKLYECEDTYYPKSLGPLMEALMSSVESLRDIVDGVEILNKQLKAVAKLQPGEEPVINTWTAAKISKEIEHILNNLKKELKLKQITLENIAHCRDEALIEVYVSSWELEPYFSIEETAFMFVDVGLTPVY